VLACTFLDPGKIFCTASCGSTYLNLYRSKIGGPSFWVGQSRHSNTKLADLNVNPCTWYLDAAPPLSPPPRAHRQPPSKECVDGRTVFAHPEITQKHSLRKPAMANAGHLFLFFSVSVDFSKSRTRRSPFFGGTSFKFWRRCCFLRSRLAWIQEGWVLWQQYLNCHNRGPPYAHFFYEKSFFGLA
jgi:hypothetical protein